MLNQTFVRPQQLSVWRDSLVGLLASLAVGMLAGTALTLVVFGIVVSVIQ